MRLKHVPQAESELKAHPDLVIQDPMSYKGRFQDRFPKKQALHLEIGTGKGQFIVEMAKAFPEINFIGIELQSSVIYRAMQKVLEEELDNVQLINIHGRHIPEIFEEGEIDGLYLNFSDPWPKNRHAKRRLTHHRFLKLYEKILSEGAFLQFKTDNRQLFEFSLQMFNLTSCQIEELSLDLHHDSDIFNIETEYEEKFSQKGESIYYAKINFNHFHTDWLSDLDL